MAAAVRSQSVSRRSSSTTSAARFLTATAGLLPCTPSAPPPRASPPSSRASLGVRRLAAAFSAAACRGSKLPPRKRCQGTALQKLEVHQILRKYLVEESARPARADALHDLRTGHAALVEDDAGAERRALESHSAVRQHVASRANDLRAERADGFAAREAGDVPAIG